MEELLRKQFEAQFGTEWSQPVVPTANTKESDAEALDSSSQASESESDAASDESGSEGPIVVKHAEVHVDKTQQKHRRQFMKSTAPKEPSNVEHKPKETEEDLKQDYELQRLIEESEILKNARDYSGADISFGDPMEQIGKARLKIMEKRLEDAGAKKRKANIPMNIAKGMKAKQSERAAKYKEYARDAGIVTAKDKKVKKEVKRDRGLKINSIGRSSAHGVHLSKDEIARVQRKGKGKKFKR